MAAVENVHRAVKSWRASKNWAKWQRDNPADWQLVQSVLKLREE